MMTGPVSATSAATPDARLREAAKALEGVFIAQLYQAMRQTVPEGGLLETGAGGEIFTQMFDEHMADVFAQRQTGGLGDRLYEQLRTAFATSHAPVREVDGHG